MGHVVRNADYTDECQVLVEKLDLESRLEVNLRMILRLDLENVGCNHFVQSTDCLRTPCMQKSAFVFYKSRHYLNKYHLPKCKLL
jgi:hypothetical protein